MTEPLSTPANLDPSSDFSATPSVTQAANDLRAAAGEKAKELAHSISSQAATLKERAVESAQHFRDVAGEKATTLKQTATERAESLRIAAAERAHRLQETATEQWSHTCERGKDIQITAEDYIRQNPTKCVVGALGIGILVGLMVRR
ncbi:MAG: hypothetical protein K9N23_20200 [Akkermansiaceae bacterium]|nr:hypothetical protein [Akkermansiaceae bacterium]MCF7734018.1 hypothetical protein [Akkermansiaceae bacterium]